MRLFLLAAVGFLFLATVSAPTSVRGSFHEWKIAGIFSDASGEAQYIQMRNGPDDSEGFLSGQAITSAANSFSLPADLPSQMTGSKSFLIGTPAYAALIGAVTPDYTVPNGFFNRAGDTIDYAGVSSFAFTAAQLPGDGKLALLVDGSTATNSAVNFSGAIGSVDAGTDSGGNAVPLPRAALPGIALLAIVAGAIGLRKRSSRI